MKTLIINTKAWTRGQYCNEHGKCCAIGFLAKKRLKDRGVVKFSQDIIEKEAMSIHIPDVVTANDGLYGEERKRELRKLFNKAGYRVRFI